MRNMNLFLMILAVILILSSCESIPQAEEGTAPADTVEALPAYIVINEVASVGDYEFIELFNLLGQTVTFSEGWLITDDCSRFDKGDTPFLIPEGTMIGPYGYLLICPFSEDDAQSVLNDKDVPADALCDISFSIGSSDAVTLYRGQLVVDSLSWEHNINSYGRVSDGLPEMSMMLSPSPGTANKAERLFEDSPLLINEICSVGEDYVELINAGSSTYLIEADSWYLEDMRKSRDIVLEGGIELKPGEVYVIYTKKQEDKLRLGSKETVILRYKNRIADWYRWDDHVESIGRDPGSINDWVVMPKSPGEENLLTSEE